MHLSRSMPPLTCPLPRGRGKRSRASSAVAPRQQRSRQQPPSPCPGSEAETTLGSSLHQATDAPADRGRSCFSDSSPRRRTRSRTGHRFAPPKPRQVRKEHDVSTATVRTITEPTTPGPVQRELPCRADNPDLWFGETPAELELAKSLCAACPVRTRCLSAALDRAE